MARDPLASALALAAEARRRILSAARSLPPRDRSSLVSLARRELARAEPLLARTLAAGQILAWLDAGRDQVKALARAEQSPNGSRTVTERSTSGTTEPAAPPPPGGYFPPEPDEPALRFPQIERAAHYLATRLDYTRPEFEALDAAARSVAFTVARVQSVAAVEAVRKAVADDVVEGGTAKRFKLAVADAVGSALSPKQVEAVYRTQVARAYSAGQQDVLRHPLVADEFPYVEWTATHDGRVRPEHLAMESLGIDGTAYYRADDPLWDTHWPPCGWNCRCLLIPRTLGDAADAGVREARRWLETGVPPARPAFTTRTPFPLPKGWVPTGRGLAAAV